MSRDDTKGLSKEAAAAARMAGDGKRCTGYSGCRCPGCREDDERRAAWAEAKHADERSAGLPFGLEFVEQLAEPFCCCGHVISRCSGSRRGCSVNERRGGAL